MSVLSGASNDSMTKKTKTKKRRIGWKSVHLPVKGKPHTFCRGLAKLEILGEVVAGKPVSIVRLRWQTSLIVRTTVTVTKYRTSAAKVLAIIYDTRGFPRRERQWCVRTRNGKKWAESRYDPSFVYRVGETVKAALGPSSPYGCGPGIHFFTKRAHAEAW